MTLEVPDVVAARSECSSDELLFGMVYGLLWQGKLSLGQAGQALGLSKPALIDAIGGRKLPMPYDEEDAAKDLETIRRLWPKAKG